MSALVALFLFVHRFVDGVDTGGDAVTAWHFVRQWWYANDLGAARWDHHMARVGMNAVAWLAQLLCGTGWRSYWVAPVFMGAVQLPFVFALARRLSNRAAGVLAGLFIIYLPAVHTSISQLLPDGFAGTYALIAAYLLVRLADERRARVGAIVALGAVAFVGYLAKETFFFFYPGLVVGLWLIRRSLRDVAIFLGTMLFGLGLETAGYALFTNYSSRLEVVRVKHFAGSDDEPVAWSAKALFAIFRKVDQEWRYLLLAAAVGIVWISLRRHRRATRLAFGLVGLSYVALLLVSTVLWQGPVSRYMNPVTPFAALCAALFIVEGPSALALVIERWRGADRLQSLGRFASQPPVVLTGTLAVVSLAGSLTYLEQRARPPFDALAHGALMAQLANDTYQRNLPLSHATRRGQVLRAFHSVFLRDQYLVRDGVLPSFEQVKQRSGNVSYIVKDPELYGRRVFRKLLAEGCSLELHRGPKALGMGGCADTFRRSPLPQRCDALLAELVRTSK